MDKKIGEIFEYNGEWYQCVIGCYCDDCAFKNDNCEERERITLTNKLTKEETTGLCTSKLRSDGKSVIFKKLEKIGEPYEHYGNLYQLYKLPMSIETLICQCYWVTLIRYDMVEIAIKQTKENMEEKKVNLKPFSLEAAKSGKPVYTRDGRKVRIICFDYKGDGNAYPILALISTSNLRGVPSEIIAKYTEDGRYAKYNDVENDEDLMMLPEKHEGYIIINDEVGIFDNKEIAQENCSEGYKVAKIQWED